MKTYSALFLFCGLGGGALGFQRASARLFGHEARFRSIGGIDNDEGACADFEYLTKSPALCADISKMTPADLRAFAGDEPPDVVFSSAPCKSFSGLTNPETAKTPKYVEMARLYVTGLELVLSTWDIGPRLWIAENVPRILSAGRTLVEEVTEILKSAGYATTISTHDCGELGGLAQHRRRALLLGRQKQRVSALLYQPTKRPVRACGEVLGELPMPEDPAAGPMHRLPRVSWLTWVRLALIPAGGDHRDIPGALAELQKRREAWGKHNVADWTAPTVTVNGPGSNGAFGVADPRVELAGGADPAKTITGATRTGSGLQSVADPRAGDGRRDVGVLGVVSWNDPSGAVKAQARTSTGPYAVADVRVARTEGRNDDHNHRILRWDESSFTIHTKTAPGNGAYSVADPRVTDGLDLQLGCAPRAGAYGVLSWEEAAKTITAAGSIDNGPFAIADRRRAASPVAFIEDPDDSPFVVVEVQPKTKRGKVKQKRVKVPVVILAEDGTWHRPMTPLELARLQDLPAMVDGEPLRLHGNNVGDWVERIGNAVPVGAAAAIAAQMLLTLLSSDVAAGLSLSGGTVWVVPELEGASCAAVH